LDAGGGGSEECLIHLIRSCGLPLVPVYAANNNQLEIVQLLLEKKADPLLRSTRHQCALGIARSRGLHQMVEVILNAASEGMKGAGKTKKEEEEDEAVEDAVPEEEDEEEDEVTAAMNKYKADAMTGVGRPSE
jgi:hypothetical protein